MARSLLPVSHNIPTSRTREDMDPFLVMRRKMNRLFDDMFGDYPFPSADWSAGHRMVSPKINVSETDNELRITAELPGVKEDDVEVMVDEDGLTIRGELAQEHEDQDKDRNYHIRERFEGAFSRTLPLPFGADPDKVQASFQDGVLTITVPKPEEAQQKRRRIHVQRNANPSHETSSESGQSAQATHGTSRREQTGSGHSSASSQAEKTEQTAAH